MALPKSKEARLFYRAAIERFKDAELIYEKVDRTTAAVYLAGYAVECVLKALILSQISSAPDRKEMISRFRGAKAHEYEWLKREYRLRGGPVLPPAVVKAFVAVEDWGTELRYNPGVIDPDDAEAFLDAVRVIMRWADGRL